MIISLVIFFSVLFHFFATTTTKELCGGQKKNIFYTTMATTTNTSDFDLASQQSNGFFYDISNKEWKQLQQIYLMHQNHRDPLRPLLYSTHDPYGQRMASRDTWRASDQAWYQNNYEPNFSCRFEKRVGGQNMNGDGPKWVCDPHRLRKLAADRKAKDPNHPGCVVYSIGSQGDFNFELGMQQEVGAGVCEFHIFDPGNYGPKVPKELERAHYHKWGLGKQVFVDDPPLGQQYYGMRDTIKLLNHTNLDVIDIFKVSLIYTSISY